MRKFFIPIFIFSASFAYAVVRYNILKGIACDHIPLFIVNKAVAMTALALLGFSIAHGLSESRRRYGKLGLALAGLHVLLTQPLLSPAYLPKLYLRPDGADGFSAAGEIAFLLGSLGLLGLLIISWPGETAWKTSPRAWMSRIAEGALALVAFHCLALGWSGWWQPSTWPGALPPITLLCFFYACIALAIGRIRESEARN